MSEIIIVQRMWQRRGTSAEWSAQNPVLAAGEIGVEFGPAGEIRAKAGNGISAWSGLPYIAGQGTPVLLRSQGGFLQYSNDAGATWVNILPISELKGDPGTPVELRVSGSLLQWRYITGGAWASIFDLATLAAGGVRPLVTGEIVDDQPRFLYNPDDGTYIYSEGL